jgi:pyruvate dehydrogenase E2 component (dihydrolipoamide acetyltransferase)
VATVLRMPEVATDATDAVLLEWLVSEAGSFSAADPIATVETDKALVEVPADDDGVLLRTLVAAGDRVEVGAPIAILGAAGEEVDVDALLAELQGGFETVAAQPPQPAVPMVEEAPPVPVPTPSNGRVFASPLARKLAKDAGIPVEEIDGTGPRNRILRRDVERAVAARRPAPAAPAVEPAPSAEQVPHSRMRRAVAARLQESKREAPHFYVRATLRADRLVALRAELNEDPATRVSLNDLVVKAVGAAHVAVPEMNAVWGPDAVTRPSQVDVAVAVATDGGLVTPVVRDVPSLSVTALAEQIRDLAERARAGRLRQDELEGGTISVTNLGMYGVEEFAAIINPPHAAILAVGAVTDAPVVEDGVLAVGKLLRVTLSVDHRPVDGVIAARWMAAFTELVEHPVRILAR